MNFGFDTIEMPNAKADAVWWARRLNEAMGWPHILTSRGWDDPAFGAGSYAGFGGNPYDLETSDKGPAGYEEIRLDLASRPGTPGIYEERHTYNRWKCWPSPVADPDRLDETGCRRLIWWETMAGGMGGFFGHFSERFNVFGPFDPDGPCGYHPESLKRAFRTFRAFWRNGRLCLDMAPANGRVLDGRGYCLADSSKTHFVFFLEDADSAAIDLTGMRGSQPLIAVDAKASYEETDRGAVEAGQRAIALPRRSDWCLAVGAF
jgi:hypothetical protein